MSLPNSPLIRIDHREQAPVLQETLTTRFGFALKTETLNLGDYALPGGTLVERKTTKDFCLSILDGRLFQQAYRLSSHAESAVILVEGRSFTDTGIDISLEAVKGAMITLAQSFRMPLLRSVDQEDSAWYLQQLTVQRARIGTNRGPLSAYYPRKLENQKKYVLRALPGIGAKTADVLLEHFGTVARVMQASEAELLEVPGIGNKTIERLQRILNEDPASYTVCL